MCILKTNPFNKGEPMITKKNMEALRNDIDVMIRGGFKQGKPISRILYINEEEVKKKKDEKSCYMHATYLACKMLNIYLDKMFGEKNMKNNRAVYLKRKTQTGIPDSRNLPKKTIISRNEIEEIDLKGWNKLIADRNFNGLFTTDLKKRRELMLDRIVIIKTFWDISTAMRARRFKHLMEEAWDK